MKTRRHKRVAGRAVPYDREKVKATLARFGLEMSDETIDPYQPWEERLLGAVNGLLQTNLASEEEVVLQTLGQYKLFCYWMENKLPELISNNPGASGKLLMAMAAQGYTTEIMLWAQRHSEEHEETGVDIEGKVIP